MKKMQKLLSLFLAVLFLLSAGSVFALADEGREIRMLCYNVAGLPSVSGIIGMQGADVSGNQTQLGKQLNSSGYDIIAVQEDFGYHCNLVRGLTNYKYKTVHSGGIPGGDGMNVFSRFPIYNAKRTPWDQTYGVINDGADELTPKGILYTVLDLGDGLTVDFYVIHADAFDDPGSRAARNDNFRQLSQLILSKGNERPVIVTGDFNTSSHLEQGAQFTEYMIRNAGFMDAWTELYNGGNYTDYSSCPGTYGSAYWGVWDSVEKVLYRDGGGVHVDVTDFSYRTFTNSKGESISDHNAASATIRFTPSQEHEPASGCLRVTRPGGIVSAVVNKVTVVIRDLKKIFAHIDDLFALIG